MMKKTYIILIISLICNVAHSQEKLKFTQGKYFNEKYSSGIASLHINLATRELLDQVEENAAGFSRPYNISFFEIATKIQQKDHIDYILHIEGIDATMVGVFAKYKLTGQDTIFLETIQGKVCDLYTIKDTCGIKDRSFKIPHESELIIRLRTTKESVSGVSLFITKMTYYFGMNTNQIMNPDFKTLKADENYACAYSLIEASSKID